MRPDSLTRQLRLLLILFVLLPFLADAATFSDETPAPTSIRPPLRVALLPAE